MLASPDLIARPDQSYPPAYILFVRRLSPCLSPTSLLSHSGEHFRTPAGREGPTVCLNWEPLVLDSVPAQRLQSLQFRGIKQRRLPRIPVAFGRAICSGQTHSYVEARHLTIDWLRMRNPR